MAAPRKCCVCLDVLHSAAKAHTCGECEATTCQPCMLRYVKEMCTSVLKCPAYECTVTIKEAALECLFSKTFVRTELTRIRNTRLIEQDAKYLPVTKLLFLPLARRLAQTPQLFTRAEAVTADVKRRILADANRATACFATTFGVQVRHLAGFNDVCFRDIMGFVDLSTPYSWMDPARNLGSFQPVVLTFALKYWPAAEARLGTEFLGAMAAMRSGKAADWRNTFKCMSMKFALFFSAFFQMCLNITNDFGRDKYDSTVRADWRTKDIEPVIREHLSEMRSGGVIELVADLFKTCHEYTPAVNRESEILVFADDIKKALRAEQQVARSANVAVFPDFEASFSADLKYSAPARDVAVYGVPARRFDFMAAAGDGAKPLMRVFNCPGAGCDGVFDSADGKCNTCSTTFCTDCHAKVDGSGEHECVAAELASVAEIKSSTKPCPKCVAPVFRLAGCDQMMCTVCHTLFLFSTGALVTRSSCLHNPHYMALSKEAKEAVRKQMEARSKEGGGASAAASKVELSCIALEDPAFHLEFQNSLRKVACADDKTVVPAIATLRFWETLQRDAATKRAAILESERLDRIERLQFMVGTVLPFESIKEFTATPFTDVHYARRLHVTSTGRAKRHATLTAKQAVCDVARELLVGVVTTTQQQGRVVLLNALVTLRKDFIDSRKRKRGGATAISDAEEEEE